MSNILLIIGGLALALVAYYSYQRRKTRKTKSKEELIEELLSGFHAEVEEVDKLAMADVVNYFKSFRLRKGRDIPFIAKTKKDGTYLFLGTFNEETNMLENWKVVAPNSIDDELLKVLGNETLVVLS